MSTDTELRMKGSRALAQSLGDIEVERFIALIQRESSDYTQWRQDKWQDLSIDEISRSAMLLREKSAE